jgi:hypothetical protein
VRVGPAAAIETRRGRAAIAARAVVIGARIVRAARTAGIVGIAREVMVEAAAAIEVY